MTHATMAEHSRITRIHSFILSLAHSLTHSLASRVPTCSNSYASASAKPFFAMGRTTVPRGRNGDCLHSPTKAPPNARRGLGLAKFWSGLTSWQPLSPPLADTHLQPPLAVASAPLCRWLSGSLARSLMLLLAQLIPLLTRASSLPACRAQLTSAVRVI